MKISWSKGIEVTQSLWSHHCGIMLEINIKRYLKITHIFSSAMCHLPREIFDLAIESLNKVKRLKKHRGWLQRRKHLNEKLISNIFFKCFTLCLQCHLAYSLWELEESLYPAVVCKTFFQRQTHAFPLCKVSLFSKWGKHV